MGGTPPSTTSINSSIASLVIPRGSRDSVVTGGEVVSYEPDSLAQTTRSCSGTRRPALRAAAIRAWPQRSYGP
nr:hypothetical protein [Nonomuraea aridisoli]